MKTITIITEQVSDVALSAALPARGIASVTVNPDRAGARGAAAAQGYRGLHGAARFAPAYRIDLVVDDAAVESVFEGVSIAYGAGLFSDAEMWVNAPALAA